MSFPVGGSTRAGAVSVRGANNENPREQSFNLDPGAGIYRPVDRKLAVSMGAGSISAELQTSSEFMRFNDSTKRCDGLVFNSKGTVGLPSDLSVPAMGVVEDNIRMGFRVEKNGKLQGARGSRYRRDRIVGSAVFDAHPHQRRLRSDSRYH